ncbi:MAG TPA: hypothetical protein DDY70_05625 [Clostridiales bacterium]|nr:hypothetical protein [Clostridiales bacterium]
MKRKITIIFLLLSVFVLCIALAACNGNKGDKTIKNLSGDCGFTAEGEFAEDSTLVVEPLREATDEQKALIAAKDICVDNNMQVYDISVQKDNAKVQPNGKVKITLDFDGDSPNGYTVFHFKSDTEMEVLPATLSSGKLSFETTSFSVFIIGENKPEEYNYNITYNLDGGSFAEGVTAPTSYSNESDFPLALPTPEKSGYTFKGWKNAYDVEMTEITANIRGDITLTAIWQEPAYTRTKDGIVFGSYPQSQVKDESLIAKLNSATGVDKYEDLNDVEIEGWAYLEYRKFGELAENIAFKDITLDGATYRGIYIKDYTQREACLAKIADSSFYQKDYKYIKGDVYWFKFEPIKWVILKEDKENGKAMLMAELALDVKPFQDQVKKVGDLYYVDSEEVPDETAAYNWEYSYIRKWLNDTFYNTAFTDLQKEIIQTTKIDNSAYDGTLRLKDKSPNEDYNNPDTEDKIFLLSLQEFLTLPRFQPNLTNNDNYVGYADYYKAMGGLLKAAIKNGETVYSNGASYIFRTPRNGYGDVVWGYSYANTLGSNPYKQYDCPYADNQNYGIVPVLWINL